MIYKYKYTAIFNTWDGKNLNVGQIIEQERNVGFTREWMKIIWNSLQIELMNYGAAHVGLKVEALLEINGELARIFRLSFYQQDIHPGKLFYTLQTTGMRANDPYEWRTLREGMLAE